MMPKIIHAKDYDIMCQLAELFEQSKYTVQNQDKNFILLKKRNFGNPLIHAVFLFIGLLFFYPAILVNVVYFAYSVFQKSNFVLITTETEDDEGNPLEFDDVSDLEVFYEQEIWDKAIELSKLE